MVSDIYLYKKCERIRFLKDELILDNIRGFYITCLNHIYIYINIIRIKMPTPYKKTWYNEYPNTTYYSISMHKQNLVSGIFRFFCIFSFYGKVTPSKTFYVPWVLRLILHVIGNLYFTRINLFYRHRFPTSSFK